MVFSQLYRYLFPHVIARETTSVNGEIQVIEQFGHRYISVGGIAQSGGLVSNIWEHAVRNVKKSKKTVKKCLLLGVGGGTVIQLLRKECPGIQIVGVDLDKGMIRVGEKYFGLSCDDVTIYIDDAFRWVAKHVDREEQFDLIIIDLYIGKNNIVSHAQVKFLKNLKKLLSTDGTVMINYLLDRKTKKQQEIFIHKVKSIFSNVATERPLVNLLLICSE